MASKLPQQPIHAHALQDITAKSLLAICSRVELQVIKSSPVRLEQQLPNTYSPAAATAARRKPNITFIVVSILHYDVLVY